MNDLGFAIRQLLKHPAFAVASVLTLALGIGANTTMFSVVNGVVLKPLQYEEAGQLVQVWEAPRLGEQNSVSLGVFADWSEEAGAFEALAAVREVARNLTAAGDPERLRGLAMSASGLRLLRARPLLGRIFAPDEDQAGKPNVVVLTERLWRRRFASDPGLLGRDIRLDGEAFTVIGVLPPNFLPLEKPEFVIPFAIDPARRDQRGNHYLEVLGRLKPGLTAAQGRADLERVAEPRKPLYPAWKRDWGVTVVPMHEQITGDVRPTLLTLLGAVGLVMLIACANVANLQLAKATAREKEIAVRLALGASRGRIVRQLLTESLLLSTIGGALGVVAAVVGVSLLRQSGPDALPRLQQVGVDWPVLAFAVAVSAATGVVFGLAPALPASRPDLNRALNEGGRSGIAGRSRVRNGLIVAEVALALVLLVGAGLLLNSFVRLASVPPGFDTRNALTMQLSLPEGSYPDAERRSTFFDRVLERIGALPGVTEAGVTTSLPLTGGPNDMLMSIAGRKDAPAEGYDFDYSFASPGYFPALGLPLTRGRLFDRGDNVATATPVALVNETLAREYFKGEDALGQHLVENGNDWEIVGIVGDAQLRELGQPMRPLVYMPFAFAWNNMETIVVRTAVTPMALADAVRRTVSSVDPGQPVANVRSMEEVVSRSVAQRRLVMNLLAGFALMALLLAALGLYGVIAYAVSQRTREIGIRAALGAQRRDVLALVVGQGARLAALGIAIGVAGALVLTRTLESQLYGVKATDPATFASVAFVLLLVALFAAWLPARHAARIDPMTALREG